MTSHRMYAMLAYAGTLPFIACAVLPWIGIPVIPGIGSCAYIAATYGVAIASFMAGIHWGTHLYHAPRAPMNLLLTSNVVTLTAWLTFLLTPVTVSLAVLAIAFLFLLFVDFRLAGQRLLTSDYLRTRRNVTGIVVLMLITTFASA